MNKEFVPYEQALELKELGFDEPCYAYYEYDTKLVYTSIVSQNTNSFWVLATGIISAPLYQQAFRWFREKYNWSTEIRGANFRASYVIGIPETINYDSLDGFPLVTHWNYVVDDSGVRKTYEEAELACLKKLIEIVKNK
jgi:hypothetical protein